MDNVTFIAAAWMGLALVACLGSIRLIESVAAEEVEAAEEIDAGPLSRPRRAETA